MPMQRHTSWIALLTMLFGGTAGVMADDRAASSVQSEQQAASPSPTQLIIGGAVRRVLGSDAFILEDRQAADGELLVLAPGVEATPVPGATVIARGLFRTFDEAELERMGSWNDIDERTREGFARRPILLAAALTTASGRSLMAVTTPVVRPFVQRSPVVPSRPRAEIQLHPAGLAALIDEVGGRPVVLPRARVLAVFNPRAFLIESASLLNATPGNLNRVLVLTRDAPLRVDAAALTGEDVRVVGVARTLLGVQVTREVPWPAELSPGIVKQFEIRASVLATSVHTADGVELTDPDAQTPAR
jgi:hypothetical protein